LVAEVIYVAHDKEDAAFNRNFLKMPWISIPFTDDSKKAQLTSKYGITELPSFVVLSPDGKVFKDNARDRVMEEKEGGKVLEEWAAEAAGGGAEEAKAEDG